MPHHGVADAKSSVELVTAPRTRSSRVWRDAVIRASVAEGLPVREELKAVRRGLLTEAFLTNAVRLVQPVREGGGRATGIRVTGRGRNDSSRIRGLTSNRSGEADRRLVGRRPRTIVEIEIAIDRRMGSFSFASVIHAVARSAFCCVDRRVPEVEALRRRVERCR